METGSSPKDVQQALLKDLIPTLSKALSKQLGSKSVWH